MFCIPELSLRMYATSISCPSLLEEGDLGLWSRDGGAYCIYIPSHLWDKNEVVDQGLLARYRVVFLDGCSLREFVHYLFENPSFFLVETSV